MGSGSFITCRVSLPKFKSFEVLQFLPLLLLLPGAHRTAWAFFSSHGSGHVLQLKSVHRQGIDVVSTWSPLGVWPLLKYIYGVVDTAMLKKDWGTTYKICNPQHPPTNVDLCWGLAMAEIWSDVFGVVDKGNSNIAKKNWLNLLPQSTSLSHSPFESSFWE